MKAFAELHPLVLLEYYIFTIGFSMVMMEPVCLSVSLLCAFISSVSLDGGHKAAFNLKYMIPVLVTTALINPAFNHRGATILTYLSSGNPLTLESIAYGIAAGTMLISVVCHFSCFNSVMTSDKIVYLSGRIIPSLSLIFSMTLRMVPRFIDQTKRVSTAQRGIGRDARSGNILARMKNAVTIISIMITWSLESAIETADSMKSRGYGLKGRTAFSLFRMDKRDTIMLLLIAALGTYVIFGYYLGGIYWRWFPTMRGHEISFFTMTIYAAYAGLMLLCPLLNLYTGAVYKKAMGGGRT